MNFCRSVENLMSAIYSYSQAHVGPTGLMLRAFGRRENPGHMSSFGRPRRLKICRQSCCVEETYAVELVDLAAAREERVLLDQLGEDAPDGPHVDGCRVVFGAEEQFWRTIPQCHDELGHLAQGVAELAGEAEVGDLDLAPVVHEQIGRLQIAMELPSACRVMLAHNPVGMAMRDGREELVHDRLDLRLQEGVRHVREQRLKVVFDEGHHDEDPVVSDGRQRRRTG